MKDLILKHLCENARYTNAQLALMIGISEKEVEKLIQEMEDDKTILKYTTVVNHQKADDKKVEALIEVKVKPQKLKGFDAFAESLTKFSAVDSVYLMSGVFDLAITIKGNSLNEIARFVYEELSSVDGVESVSTHFILKKYKEEGQTTITIDESREILWEILCLKRQGI